MNLRMSGSLGRKRYGSGFPGKAIVMLILATVPIIYLPVTVKFAAVGLLWIYNDSFSQFIWIASPSNQFAVQNTISLHCAVEKKQEARAVASGQEYTRDG